MSDSTYNPFDPTLRIYKETARENEEPSESKGSVYDYRANKDLGKVKNKQQITFDSMPEEQRNRAAEITVYNKLMQLSDCFRTIANNVKDKGFLSSDPKIQKEIILGCDAFIDYLQPLTDDKWTQGDWKNSFEQIVSHLNKDSHWSEDPEFVREYRYQIFGNGTVINKHPYTSEHILGGSIIPKINKVIKIVDCFTLFGALWKNDSQTRYQRIQKREEKRHEKRTEKKKKNGKT